MKQGFKSSDVNNKIKGTRPICRILAPEQFLETFVALCSNPLEII